MRKVQSKLNQNSIKFQSKSFQFPFNFLRGKNKFYKKYKKEALLNAKSLKSVIFLERKNY